MKLSLYEGGYRVPAIAHWKGRIPAGRVSQEPVSGVDILPTLCELAGVAPPRGRTLDGTSVAGHLTDGGKSRIRRTTPLHWHYINSLDEPTSSLRDGDWKILGIPAGRGDRRPGGGFRMEQMDIIRTLEFQRFELYNLREDIGEQYNLAAREPARLRAMADRLTAIHREVRAEGVDWRRA
jgi:arylsulfatase A